MCTTQDLEIYLLTNRRLPKFSILTHANTAYTTHTDTHTHTRTLIQHSYNSGLKACISMVTQATPSKNILRPAVEERDYLQILVLLQHPPTLTPHTLTPPTLTPHTLLHPALTTHTSPLWKDLESCHSVGHIYGSGGCLLNEWVGL